MSQNEKPTAAFILSLIAGIFILINGLVLGLIGSFIARLDLTELISRHAPQTTIPPEVTEGLAVAFLSTALYILTVIGVVIGVLVLLGAFMIHSNPAHKTAWGVIILIFSIISIVIGGGFFIGLILGIIGGALALAWKPSATQTTPTTK